MARALERAGNRIKGKAGPLRAAANGSSGRAVLAAVGATLVAEAGLSSSDLLDGAWDDLIASYQVWWSEAVDDTASTVATMFGEWKVGTPAAMKAKYADSLADSVGYMKGALDGIAEEVLFRSESGRESAEGLVPVGFTRHVIGYAGGQTDIATSGHAFVALTSTGAPVGGIATGPIATDAMKANGVDLTGYRWVYGPARRTDPFDPHARLDGVVFDNFDAPVLKADPNRWPYVEHFIPGDHAHCRCDFEPIILTPDQKAALDAAKPKPPTPPPPLPTLPDKPLLKDMDAYVAGLDPVIAHYEQAGDKWMVENLKAEQAAIKAKADAKRAANKATSDAFRERQKAKKAAGKAAPAVPEPEAADTGAVGRLGRPLPDTRTVAQATRFDTPTEAQRGASFAFDNGDVEYLEINTRGVKAQPWNGVDATEFRFKMTGSGAEDARTRLGRGGWKATDGAHFNDGDIFDPNHTPRVNWESSLNTNEGYARFDYDVTTYERSLTVDGRRVHVQWVDAPRVSSTTPYAMVGDVRVYVEGKGFGVTEDLFAKVMDEVGLVRQVRYPGVEDVRAMAESRMLSVLSPKRASALTGKARQEALERIAGRFGITPDDIVIREGADGRLGAWMTDEAFDRLQAETGVSHFYHDLGSSARHPERLVRTLTSPEGGLQSTHQRWHNGQPFSGMSSKEDMQTGGADYVFTRHASGAPRTDRPGRLIVKADRAKRLDWFAYDQDSYGNTSPVAGHYRNFAKEDFVEMLRAGVDRGGGQETMFRQRIAWDDMHALIVHKHDREEVLAGLRARGVTHIGGKPIEEFVLPMDVEIPEVKPVQVYQPSFAEKAQQGYKQPTGHNVWDGSEAANSLWYKMPQESKAMSKALNEYGLTNGKVAKMLEGGFVDESFVEEVGDDLAEWGIVLKKALAGSTSFAGRPIGEILTTLEANFHAKMKVWGIPKVGQNPA